MARIGKSGGFQVQKNTKKYIYINE